MAQIINPLPYLMKEREKNPWYSPFSPSPDIGGGIRGALNSISGMYQDKRVKAQQEFENQMTERDVVTREKGAETAAYRAQSYDKHVTLQESTAKRGFGKTTAAMVEKTLGIPAGEFLALPPSQQVQVLKEVIEQTEPKDSFGPEAGAWVHEMTGFPESQWKKIPIAQQGKLLTRAFSMMDATRDLALKEEEQVAEWEKESLDKKAAQDAVRLNNVKTRLEKESAKLDKLIKPDTFGIITDPKAKEKYIVQAENLNRAMDTLSNFERITTGSPHGKVAREVIRLMTNIEAVKSGKFQEEYEKFVSRQTPVNEMMQQQGPGMAGQVPGMPGEAPGQGMMGGAPVETGPELTPEEQQFSQMTDDQVIDYFIKQPPPELQKILDDPKHSKEDPRYLTGRFIEWLIAEAEKAGKGIK